MLQPVRNFFTMLVLITSTLTLSAQLSDDFSDGNFSSNPAWSGSDASFVVNSQQQLQLQAQAEGVAWLATQGVTPSTTEWRFWVKLAFSPSDNNNAWVYLAAASADLSAKPDGLYVKLGEAGSGDAVRLMARQNGTDTEICSGTAGQIAGSFAVTVKVLRDASGNFQLFTADDGAAFVLQGTGSSTYLPSANWFGWLCKFTSSNITKFYLDNVYGGEPQVDVTPPEMLAVTATDNLTLAVTFNEGLDVASASNTGNYLVSPGNTTPATATPAGATVNLVFASPFASNTAYTLTATGIRDLSLNEAGSLSLPFSIVSAGFGDVIISEIMADPDPQVGLPLAEYVELHNTTNSPIDLAGWTLVTGSTQRPITGGTLAPQGYLVVCKSEFASLFAPYGTVATVPSLTITNTGQPLRLLNASGGLTDTLTFATSWYNDASKEEGGWSIELIDPAALCLGGSNWHASLDPSGGTPGRANSVVNLGGMPPEVASLEAVSDRVLAVVFSQPMNQTLLQTPSLYLLQGDAAAVSPAAATAPDPHRVELSFAEPFADGITYQLTLDGQLANCAGIPLAADTTLLFGKPAPASMFDVVISEIMADPEPATGLPAAEYIELHNRTNHAVDLTGWSLTTGTTLKTLQGLLLPAGSYAVVTDDGDAPLFTPFGTVTTVSSMSLPNDGATLVLRDASGNFIHSVSYQPDWYGNTAKSDGGWSLEMMDASNPCTGAANWTASRDASGGTPCRQNSVMTSNPDGSLLLALRATFISTTEVLLWFSENTDSTSAADISRYTISPPLPITRVSPVAPQFSTVALSFAQPMEPSVIYTIGIAEQVTDCAGNLLQAMSSVRVAVPVAAEAGDVAINEVLTNPAADGSDYLELYNLSDKTLDVASLGLSYQSITSDELKTVFLPSYLLLPDGYALLSRDPEQLADRYTLSQPGNLVLFDLLPDFSSEGGMIRLHAASDETNAFDQLDYDAAMHSPLLTSDDGVSLERVNPARLASDRTNWQSAASSSGYGTPGYRNSQYNANPVAAGDLVCEPALFSPDGDGRDEVTTVALRLDADGYMATVAVYDASGRRVAVLVNNQLAGTENLWSWNGITNEGNLASSGIYLVLAEVAKPDGTTAKFKTTVVVGKR